MEQEILIKILVKTLFNMIKVFTPSIIATNTLTSIIEKSTLKRLSKAEGNLVSINIPKPPEPIEEKEISEKIRKFIEPYVEKLVSYTSESNLETLKRNLKTITIKRPFPLMALYYSGSYDAKKNKIEILSKSSFGHELLHLASSYYDEESDIKYVGFRQAKKQVSIGKALNEGYTELLASRLYNKKNKVEAYKKEVKIARLFEFFFDNPKEMENYYFNHNLPGFIHHLERYAPRAEIIKLIHDIDNITEYRSAWLNPLPSINYVKTQVQLYNIFERNNPDPEKLQQFRDLVFETPMATLLIAGNEFKLNHSSLKFSHKENQNNHHR